jgi:hypothetical protein
MATFYNLTNLTANNSSPASLVFELNRLSNSWVAYTILIFIFSVVMIYSLTRTKPQSIYTALPIATLITWLVSLLMLVWQHNGESYVAPSVSVSLFFLLLVVTGLRVLIKEG